MWLSIVSAQGLRKFEDLPGCIVDGVATIKCLEVIIGNLLFIIPGVVLLILFVMLVWGGLNFMLGAGDPKKVEEARGTIKWALLGMAIVFGAFLIINIVQFLFLKEGINLGRINLEIPTPTP